MFQLKHYGNLSFQEQDMLTAEDRAWWLQRLERALKEEAKRAESASRR